MDGISLSIFLSPYFNEKEIVKMRNNISKKKENRIVGFCKRVLVPSFAGAVYAMSQMTVMVYAAGFIHNELCLKGNCGRRYDGGYFLCIVILGILIGVQREEERHGYI